MNPDVRIRPFHLRNGGFEFDGLIRIKFGGKSMVRPDRSH
jgi:hypothetical protein